ncbi:hypothetical protein Fcan01_22774 [Folsomia candida]|uniref:Uncharacterized protein n=1 Tax=Folsomia candida TaxID=158441 RepID=A0A226DAQ6_FOLCA|nr:hypothetical protein Fcan01_22774 [Folsomia candida]
MVKINDPLETTIVFLPRHDLDFSGRLLSYSRIEPFLIKRLLSSLQFKALTDYVPFSYTNRRGAYEIISEKLKKRFPNKEWYLRKERFLRKQYYLKFERVLTSSKIPKMFKTAIEGGFYYLLKSYENHNNLIKEYERYDRMVNVKRKNVTNEGSEENVNSIGFGNGLDKLFLLLSFIWGVAGGSLVVEISSRVKFRKTLAYCLWDGIKQSS